MGEKVKCIDCGFLGLVDRKSGDLCHANKRYRKEKHCEIGQPGIARFEYKPACRESCREFSPATALEEGHNEACQPIGCDTFLKYRGIGPNEHYMQSLTDLRNQLEDGRKNEASRRIIYHWIIGVLLTLVFAIPSWLTFQYGSLREMINVFFPK